MIYNDDHNILNDVIYCNYKIFFVLELSLKNNILEPAHDAPLPQYLGFLKTYRKVRERFSWKGLKNDVMEYVREYVACQ